MGAVLPSAVLTNRAVGLPALRLPGGPLVRPRYLLRDTFSRADGAIGNAEIGGAWGGGVASWKISSGKAVENNSSNNFMTLDAHIPGSVELGALITTSRATSHGTHLYARCNADLSNRFSITHESNGTTNTWNLYRVDGGVFTLLGSYQPALAANGYTWTIRVRFVGSLIVVNIDGVDRISVTDSAHLKQTIWGIRKASGGDATVAFDDFYVRTT